MLHFIGLLLGGMIVELTDSFLCQCKLIIWGLSQSFVVSFFTVGVWRSSALSL
jgi:hypothetical protein